jgi:NDP-sugar pyrophosphorylase family protein
MKAFILCAGLGTRMRPLTSVLPKALLPVCGKPAILYVFDHLKTIGIKDVIINTHYLLDKFRPILGDGSGFGINLNYSYEKNLLDTGGGLKKVEYFLRDSTFIMYNCDVICDVSLKEMLEYHKKNKNSITLLSSKKHKPKALITDEKGRVKDFVSEGKGDSVFCGIHVIEPIIFSFIKKVEKVSIIPIYKKLIENGIPINTFSLSSKYWQEIGSIESYMDINKGIVKYG